MADLVITYAAPHHLNADAGLVALRRTPGGDAWQARHSASLPVRRAVDLGIPTIGIPGTVQPAESCAAH